MGVDRDSDVSIAPALQGPAVVVGRGNPGEAREPADDEVEYEGVPCGGLALTPGEALGTGLLGLVAVLQPGPPQGGDLPVVGVVDEDVGRAERVGNVGSPGDSLVQR